MRLFVRSQDILTRVYNLLTIRDLFTGFLFTCKHFFNFLERAYIDPLESGDYLCICSDTPKRKKIRIKMLINLIKRNPGIRLNDRDVSRNILKFVIRNNYYVVLHFVKQTKKLYRWNLRRFDLLKYSITQKKVEEMEFLLDRIKFVPVEQSEEIVTAVMTTHNEDFIESFDMYVRNNEDLSRFFGRFFGKLLDAYSLTTLFHMGKYNAAIKRIREGGNLFSITQEQITEILDILVERNQTKGVEAMLSYYDGNRIGETPLLRVMADPKKQEICKKLLESNKFDVQVTKDCRHILHNKPIILACKHGWTEVVKYIISRGADPAAKDNTPIIEACRGGHIQVVRLLLSTGKVDPTTDQNYALDEAKRYDHIAVVSLLRKHIMQK